MRTLIVSLGFLLTISCVSAATPLNMAAGEVLPDSSMMTHPSGHHGDVLVKICNASWACEGTSCTTYTVPPHHCFTGIPGQAMKFACENFAQCVSGEEYFGNSCSGYGRNYSAPCNTCLGGRYVKCANNMLTQYDCMGSHDHPHSGGTGPNSNAMTCANLTACDIVFGPAPMTGECATIQRKHSDSHFNVSLILPAATHSCDEIRVDQFFTNNCDLQTTTTAAAADVEAVTTMPSGPPSPPHDHPHHHELHHIVYYMPDNQCVHHEEARGMSVQFSCASHGGHHHGDVGAQGTSSKFPLATPEVMELIHKELAKEKRDVMGHPSLKKRLMQPVFVQKHQE